MSLTLHKSRQVQCSGNMQWWACSSLNLLLCLQRQVTKLGSELFYSWPLLRNNELATNPRRCPLNYGNRRFAAAVLPTSRFSREFDLIFCQVAGFLKTCVLLVFGLVLFEICLFFTNLCFADCFFFKFSSLLKFQFTAKGNLGVFLWKFAHFGLVSSDVSYSCFYI